VKFGPVAVGDCAGAILAHGLRVPGGVLKKGRLLADDDIAALREAGYEQVVVARLESDDVAEDAAAAALAGALAGDGVVVARAFTGRCNLLAEQGGLLALSRRDLDALNAVDEAMTVATLAPHTRVSARQLLATIKIIPFAVSRASLDRALDILRGAPAAVRVAPLRSLDVALVQTRLPGTRDAVLDKTAGVVGRRLEALGSRVVREVRCEHGEEALTRIRHRRPA
jgi:molybdenum cofactor cytidylyltransferase